MHPYTTQHKSRNYDIRGYKRCWLCSDKERDGVITLIWRFVKDARGHSLPIDNNSFELWPGWH